MDGEARDRRRGWINGVVGMMMFSGSLPATRAAVAGFDPVFLTWARAAIAGTLALIVLFVRPHTRPRGADWASLVLVAAACVIGFPLLSALALRQMTSADALVFVGMLPLATAIAAQLRGESRPHPVFWLFASAGSALVVVFALGQGGHVQGFGAASMLTAVIICGFGYAEGGRLSRRLGGWQVISWALVLALPLALILGAATVPATLAHVGSGAWAGLVYVSVISMFVGFVFWYDGLARGGTAAVGQLQLLQPFFGLLAAALVLHERVGLTAVLMLAGTLVCAAGARRFAASGRIGGGRRGAQMAAGGLALVVMSAVSGATPPAGAASFPERLYDRPSEPTIVPTVMPRWIDHGAGATIASRSRPRSEQLRPRKSRAPRRRLGS